MRVQLAATSFVLLLTAMGCAVRQEHDRVHVSNEITARTGHAPGPEEPTAEGALPEGVSLEDGLTADEAAAFALWNNAAFQADLAELGFARADLLEAGLLRNPVLSLLFPIGAKQLEATLSWPIAQLWHRPRRIAVAKLDAERVAENLIQHGLDLVRDARVAHADACLAGARADVAAEAVRVRGQIAEIAGARLRAGDIAELELNVARAEARLAEEQARRLVHDEALARNRLVWLLGLGDAPPAFETTCTAAAVDIGVPSELLQQAYVARPDLRAAELALEAAGARAGLERSKILAISAVLDYNEMGSEGSELGPGLLIDLPFLDQNDVARARAGAELERAARRYVVVRHRIAFEVEEAHTQLVQARDAHESWQQVVLQPLEDAVSLAGQAYAAGETSYLFVLETTRPLLEASLRRAEIVADLERAAAQLDRSVGSQRIETD